MYLKYLNQIGAKDIITPCNHCVSSELCSHHVNCKEPMYLHNKKKETLPYRPKFLSCVRKMMLAANKRKIQIQ